MNIFGVALTNQALSSNNRSENDDNYSNLQKIQKNGETYTVVSSFAWRNRMREVFKEADLKVNRERFYDPENPQPSVKYNDKINIEEYIDDYTFGYVIANKKEKKDKLSNTNMGIQRKSVVLFNHAVSTSPFEGDTILQQYPKQYWKEEKEGKGGGLLQNEIHCTSYQIPFALEHIEKWPNEKWVGEVLKAIGNIGLVAGNHARSLFDFSPSSIIIRVSESSAYQFDQYGFDQKGNFSDIKSIKSLIKQNSRKDFWFGGKIVEKLENDNDLKGCNFYDTPSELLKDLGEKWNQ
jgi:CRISPR-associated protein Cst2